MTERMVGILRVLDNARQRNALNVLGADYRMTPNHIATSLGLAGKAGTGGAPANRINFALTRLEHLGLVHYARRPDGLSGTAYYITEAGREALSKEQA